MRSVYPAKRPHSLKITLSDEERAEVEALARYLRVSLAHAFRSSVAAELARVTRRRVA
jgi:hypothetical protein